MLKPPKQSYWWYAPVVIVLLWGYAVGGLLAFGVYFVGWIPQIGSPSARFTISMFGMGMLGATMYSTQWWARDMEEAIADTKVLPHFFDFVGYATTVVGGGVTGVVFFLTLRLTAPWHSSPLASRPSVLLLVSSWLSVAV